MIPVAFDILLKAGVIAFGAEIDGNSYNKYELIEIWENCWKQMRLGVEVEIEDVKHREI